MKIIIIKLNMDLKSKHINEARDLLTKGDIKYHEFTCFWVTDNKYEIAAEFYETAAHKFKLAFEWKDSLQTYLKCIKCYQKITDIRSSARAYLNCSLCCKQLGELEKEIEYLKNAIQLFLEFNDIFNAIKHQKCLGEIHYNRGNYNDALINYQLVLDYCKLSDCAHEESIRNVQEKIANIYYETNNYNDAAKLYEIILKNNKYVSANVYRRYGLAYIIDSFLVDFSTHIDEIIHGIEEIYQKNGMFEFEYRLLLDLIIAIDDRDIGKFDLVLKKYDNIRKLDDHDIHVCILIMNNLSSNL